MVNKDVYIFHYEVVYQSMLDSL